MALSRQWNRWKEFRVWQLYGRHRKPGFDECLDAHRRDYFMSGGTSSGAAESDFERTARRCWSEEYDYEDGDDVGGHAERLGRRLEQQGLVLRQPFSLLADPKGQDQWTTYAEYLAFEAEAARRLEKRVKIRDGDEEKYQAAKAAAKQQQSRVGWVLSEMEKIEVEQDAASGESSGSKSGNSRNREPMDDTNRPEDVFTPAVETGGRVVASLLRQRASSAVLAATNVVWSGVAVVIVMAVWWWRRWRLRRRWGRIWWVGLRARTHRSRVPRSQRAQLLSTRIRCSCCCCYRPERCL